MLVRLFGIFGIILGAAYFNEGVRVIGILQFAASQKLSGMFLTWLSFLAWDFLFGGSLIIAAIGVLLFKEWGRMMWLGLMPALVLVHFGVIAFHQTFRNGSSKEYFLWTSMVVLSTALSWWYLTRPRIRARFLPEAQQ
jgi:hypothetical protein